ncbi:hypothetical protein HF086_018244 [Spodoptera exigua]|uniref:Uncharacterized protein n=1 Tax=Spodoptera exigua TaxID=7107 RepID=A0A922M678_SPOEX|nr:hypothetical protein HF086_018244 [Spodoptera exigua]
MRKCYMLFDTDLLRNWESRERRKAKEYEKERERERCREEEREKEAKRLKEFLEDYDDERGRPQVLQGEGGGRRARAHARGRGARGAARARLGARAPDDPAARAAFDRARAALDAQYRPRLLIDARLRAARERERYLRLAAVRELPCEASPIESDSSGAASGGADAGADPAEPASPPASPPRTPPRLHRHHRRASPPSSDAGTTPPQPPTPPHHSPSWEEEGGRRGLSNLHTKNDGVHSCMSVWRCKNADSFADHKVIRNRTVTSTGSSPITISFKNHHKLSPSANDTPNGEYSSNLLFEVLLT